MHRSRAYLASLLVLVLLLTPCATALGLSASDITESQERAKSARQKASKADARAEMLTEEARELDTRISKLAGDVAELAPQIEAASKRTKELEAEVERLRKEIAAKEKSLEKTQAEFTRQSGLLENRMTSAYKQGDLFYLDLLLGSEDFGDLVVRTELVARVLESNQQIAQDLARTRDELERTRVELERTLEVVAARRAEAAAAEDQLRDLKNARQAKLSEQKSIHDRKTELVAENKANAERLRALAAEEEAEAARIAEVLAARAASAGSSAGTFSGGAMAWPAAGSVSSGFGWRTHPIFGDRRFHQGIDISAASGTPVVAAAAGTVIRAEYGWGGGYGNRIWIEHGGGVVTTYNHLLDSSFAVSNGQQVARGKPIASVGSTGYSTGAHLHFEVRVGGQARDPMGYLR